MFYKHNLGLDATKSIFGGLGTTKAQTRMHLRLISTFVILVMERIISKLATGEISIL